MRLVPVVVLLLVLLVVIVTVAVAITASQRGWAAAETGARWQRAVRAEADGTTWVGVERRARRGRSSRLLGSRMIATLDRREGATDQVAFVEAMGEAAAIAAELNELEHYDRD